MIPVTGYSEMMDAVYRCGILYRSMIFLNCGNVYDMTELI